MFSTIFLIFLVAGTFLQIWLGQRQITHVAQNQHAVPAEFAAKVSLEEHQKAATYTIAKSRLAQRLLAFEALILLLWTFGGLLNWFDGIWRDMGWSPLWTGVAVMFSFSIVNSIIDMPASLYKTFGLEAKFGFNRTTLRTYVMDLFKGLALGVLLGLPLLVLILWLMESAGALWWLYAWGVLMAFNLLLLWAYPTFIAPWFNEFKALDQAELRQRIENLLHRNGFSSDGVFVMDGSKRSGHGNAYFTGLGSQKRIVFFDTLLEQLQAAEVEAVLAHEVGHFKRKHVQKRLIMMAIISLGALALLGWLMQQAWFYHGLGIANESTYMALLLFNLALPVFGIFFSPLLAQLSRRHEFEADDFAAEQSDADTLSQALVKLYRENANTLTPDPLYSAFYDSHPPAPVRIAHLKAAQTA
jgi:STE24 endopeptidase